MSFLPNLAKTRRQLSRQRLVWHRRVATTGGAIIVGLAALAFAHVADRAQAAFNDLVLRAPLAPLILTPLAFAVIVYVTRRWVPEARGSGIPQVIAAARNPGDERFRPLTSMRTAFYKLGLTLVGLLAGASVGREGPTVQIGAAIMEAAHRLFRMRLGAAVYIAGGAAGVSAAFNTPLAGVAFAIEELASAYEQKLALLVMAAVMISGLVSLGLAGDYLYFGGMANILSLSSNLVICPIAGVLGGLAGGLFSRAVLDFGRSGFPAVAFLRKTPVAWALACGAAVAVFGIAAGGLTWGTGYEAARTLVEGGHQPLWFAPAKFAASLLTALAGLPGGIFAPSLATGAGLGGMLCAVFPSEPTGPIVLLGMIAYFTGVTRAPLTAVLIISEMTDSRAMILPLFAAALIADSVSSVVCPERIYHGLAKGFAMPPAPEAPSPVPPSGPESRQP